MEKCGLRLAAGYEIRKISLTPFALGAHEIQVDRNQSMGYKKHEEWIMVRKAEEFFFLAVKSERFSRVFFG